jgi:hypothetical protein
MAEPDDAEVGISDRFVKVERNGSFGQRVIKYFLKAVYLVCIAVVVPAEIYQFFIIHSSHYFSTSPDATHIYRLGVDQSTFYFDKNTNDLIKYLELTKNYGVAIGMSAAIIANRHRLPNFVSK